MGLVKDIKFFGNLTRALGATPYQKLTPGTTTTRSLVLKALDDETLKAVYVTMCSIPTNGVTTRELVKNWTEEGREAVERSLQTLAKEYLLVTGEDASPTFEVDLNTVETNVEMVGFRMTSAMNSGLFRMECLVKVRKP